jgi:hypothetical protein
MCHRILLCVSLFLFYAHSALATEAIFTTVPNAAVVGRGVLTYVFWDIYAATLYAPHGRWDPAKPYALSLEYYRELDGKDIADRSVQEMRKEGFTDEVKLATWNAQLKTIFPDVKNGSVLSAIYLPEQETVFYNGDNVIGRIKGDEFGRCFFAIWLGQKTSAPELRRALLGLS